MRQSNLLLVLSALVLAVLGVLFVVSLRPGSGPVTPLAKAAAAGDPGEVRALLEHGAPPETATEGWSPLMWAARSGEEESVRLLVEAGADPDRQDEGPNGWTPLLHAVH